MLAIWFASDDDKETVRQDIALAHNAFKRLSAILNKKLKDNAVKDYDKAAWPFYQADTLGWNRALTEVLKLIKEEA